MFLFGKAHKEGVEYTESQRHGKQIVRASVETIKEQHRLVLLQEIADTAPARKDGKNKLRDEIGDAQAEHSRIMKTLRDALIATQETEGVERRRAQAAAIRECRARRADELRVATQAQEQEIRGRINDEYATHAQRRTELEERQPNGEV
jgi:hypothetical protein